MAKTSIKSNTLTYFLLVKSTSNVLFNEEFHINKKAGDLKYHHLILIYIHLFKTFQHPLNLNRRARFGSNRQAGCGGYEQPPIELAHTYAIQHVDAFSLSMANSWKLVESPECRESQRSKRIYVFIAYCQNRR